MRRYKVFSLLVATQVPGVICFHPDVLVLLTTKLSKRGPNDTTRGSALELIIASL